MLLESILGWLHGGGAAERGARQAPPSEPPAGDPVDAEQALARLRRRAIRMEIGGFRPPEGPGGSWFGRVNLALPGEEWPTHDGKPMYALAQVDLTQLPFRPPRLEDVEMITVFIDDDLPGEDEPNGDGWCLRAYPELSRLVPLQQADTGSYIKPLPMRPEVIEADHPSDMEESIELPELSEDAIERFQPAEGFKLGGWPYLVQHEISWDWGDPHAAEPEYVFQIDSTDKGNWMWGDTGVGYFGRGTRPGRTDEWTMTWQCY